MTRCSTGRRAAAARRSRRERLRRRSHDLSLFRFAGGVHHQSFGSKKVSCFQPIWRSASGVSQATPALLSQ
jgi:hypothetical protein